MEEKLKNYQNQRNPPPLVQDAGDQRYDVEEVEIWAEQYVSTSVPAEAMTTWRSVLMMPKSHKRRKEKTSHRPRPVTQQYIKDTKKLDVVGPVDNRPSTDKLHHFVRGKNKNYMIHVTRDT